MRCLLVDHLFRPTYLIHIHDLACVMIDVVSIVEKIEEEPVQTTNDRARSFVRSLVRSFDLHVIPARRSPLSPFFHLSIFPSTPSVIPSRLPSPSPASSGRFGPQALVNQ